MSVSEIFKSMEYGPAPESTEQANAWLDSHGRKFKLFIGGKWARGNGKPFKAYSPSSGDDLASIAQASKADVNKAVNAAQSAGKAWRNLSGFKRSKYLYALARLVQKHARVLAVLESMDNGKPIRENPRYRYPACSAPFLLSCGLGLNAR